MLGDGIFGVFEGILGGVRDVFVAREETRAASASRDAALRAASALNQSNTDRLRLFAMVALGLGFVFLITRQSA